MGDPFAAGAVSIRQTLGLTKIELRRDYDLILGCISWERRSDKALSALGSRKKSFQLLKFASTNPIAETKKQDALSRILRVDPQAHVLELERSTSFGANAERIEQLLRDQQARIMRPLRILVDITCLPKSYLLFLLGCGFRREYASRIDCIYAEGAYSLDSDHAGPGSNVSGIGRATGIVSEGEWRSLQVPYLEAENAMPTHRDLLVAMGGEVGLSIPLIEKYEPRRLGMVLIAESLVQNPDKLVPSERAALLSMLAEANVERVDFALCDVIGLTKFAIEFCRSSLVDVVTALAIGSKPHALALGLAALSEDKLEVICRIPASYRALDVAATGQLAIYEIDDRFEPSAYLP